MLYLKGLSLSAGISGTVSIVGIAPEHRGFGATSQKRLLIQNDLGEMFIVEDQIIEAEVR